MRKLIFILVLFIAGCATVDKNCSNTGCFNNIVPSKGKREIIYRPKLDYPFLAEKYGVEGEVVVELIVDGEGAVVEAEVVEVENVESKQRAFTKMTVSNISVALKDHVRNIKFAKSELDREAIKLKYVFTLVK